MRTSTMMLAVVAAAGLAGAAASGCSSHSTSSTAPSESAVATTAATSATSPAAPAQPADYTGLLINATDITAPEEFTASPPVQNPDGQAGVSTSFSNSDGSHVITVTILILPDPAAAAGALDSSKAELASSLGRPPQPADVGIGGTTVSGKSPDGSKSVTVLLFTEGKAFATLKFDGPPIAAAPPDFVADVGQKQAAAIKAGLPG